MPPALALFARTYFIGIAVAAPVGPLGMLCIQRTVERGWRAGVATGLGIATGDATYAALAAFGVSAISAALVHWQIPLRIIGGTLLVYLGVRAMRTPPSADAAAGGPHAAESRHGAAYVSAVGLTLTNPLTIMSFGAVFASAGLVAQPGLVPAALATLGIACGSLSWWLVLVTAVSLARHAAGPRLLEGVSRVSGAVIVAFGVLAIISAGWTLMR